MKKITRLTLEEMAQVLPVLPEEETSQYIGGGDGSKASPYTLLEYQKLCIQGNWHGGYVSLGGRPTFVSSDNLARRIVVSGIDGWDDRYTGGYVQGFDAALSPSPADDIAGYVNRIINSIAAGSDWGDVNYELLYHSDGIREGYLDGLKEKERMHLQELKKKIVFKSN